MNMTGPQAHALNVLAGCPDGVTLDALRINCNVAPATIYQLVEQGLARAQRQTLRQGITIWRFWINDAGKAARNGGKNGTR